MNLREEFKKETGLNTIITRTFDDGVQVDIWNDEYIGWLENKQLSIVSEMLKALNKVWLDIKLTGAFRMDSPIVRDLEGIIKKATDLEK